MVAAFFFFLFTSSFTQTASDFTTFQVLYLHLATPVKNQFLTNTCWSFAVVSFLESELLRMGKDTLDFSEMYFVRKVYEDKALKFVRMHGSAGLSGGGVLNDVPDALVKYGIVPQQVYPAMNTGGSLQMHNRFDEEVKTWLSSLITDSNRQISCDWFHKFSEFLDGWLGPVPESFQWKGKSYTPESFADTLGLHGSDYYLLTSFTHHPWYEKFVLEIPDNWNWGQAWNLPLADLLATVRYALTNGYTLAWAADISEPGFDWKNGIALLSSSQEDTGSHPATGAGLYFRDSIPSVGQEPEVNEHIRQQWFDTYLTTDDHAMHLIGMATDSGGKYFYIAKNSWGTMNSKFNGYLMISEPYLLAKTISVLVHKGGIPPEIREKMKIEKK